MADDTASLRARLEAGALSRERLELAALLDHPAARALLDELLGESVDVARLQEDPAYARALTAAGRLDPGVDPPRLLVAVGGAEACVRAAVACARLTLETLSVRPDDARAAPLQAAERWLHEPTAARAAEADPDRFLPEDEQEADALADDPVFTATAAAAQCARVAHDALSAPLDTYWQVLTRFHRKLAAWHLPEAQRPAGEVVLALWDATGAAYQAILHTSSPDLAHADRAAEAAIAARVRAAVVPWALAPGR